MHSGSESQSQHNITTSMSLFYSLGRHFWILVVSLSQTPLPTHSTVGEMPLGNIMTVCMYKTWKATTNRKSWGKSDPLPQRIAQSGGKARPRESSPLSGQSLWSGLGLLHMGFRRSVSYSWKQALSFLSLMDVFVFLFCIDHHGAPHPHSHANE